MNTIHEIAYSKAGIWQLGLLISVAAIAYFARSRRLFLMGTLGTFLGYIVPQRIVYTNYRSVEGAFMGAVYAAANHLVFWAVVGATVCVTLVLDWRKKSTHSAASDSARSESE
jgi:hypothetical protein